MSPKNGCDRSRDRRSTNHGSQVTNHGPRAAARRARPEGLRPASARLKRHQRCCRVCRHPDRDLIEYEFLHWCSPTEIAIRYEIADRASITRHAHATGLYAHRTRRVRSVLERVIERAEEAAVNGHSIVRAVRAYLRIKDDDKCVEPPTVAHISHLPACSNFHSEPSTTSLADDSEADTLPQADANSPAPALPPAVPQLTEDLGKEGETERTAPEAGAPKQTVLRESYDPAPMVSHPFVPVYPEPGRSPGHRKH
jgi:hypothetical protein